MIRSVSSSTSGWYSRNSSSRSRAEPSAVPSSTRSRNSSGYSALSYLQTFPLDVLKIDRSFVSGIDHDDERARLVRSIVEMGHNLSLSVVSEGIEEAGEAALMREFRSQYGQGYLFSKPVDVATLDHLLADNKTLMESA